MVHRHVAAQRDFHCSWLKERICSQVFLRIEFVIVAPDWRWESRKAPKSTYLDRPPATRPSGSVDIGKEYRTKSQIVDGATHATLTALLSSD